MQKSLLTTLKYASLYLLRFTKKTFKIEVYEMDCMNKDNETKFGLHYFQDKVNMAKDINEDFIETTSSSNLEMLTVCYSQGF